MVTWSKESRELGEETGQSGSQGKVTIERPHWVSFEQLTVVKGPGWSPEQGEGERKNWSGGKTAFFPW